MKTYLSDENLKLRKCIGPKKSAFFKIIGIAIILCFVSCSSKEKAAWENAKSVNTSASYDVYLTQYPDGQFLVEAKSQKEEAFWIETKKEDTYEAYDKYLDNYMTGKYSDDALKKRSALEPADSKQSISNTKEVVSTEVTEKVKTKIKALVDDYCKNLFSESFDGSDYFADEVEQFISMTNTTAKKITTYIKDSYHKEFQNGKYFIEDDLYTVTKLADGNYEAFFIEAGSCVRKSLNKTQHVRIKIKAVLNSDFKIINWQEIQIFQNKLD